MATVSWRTEMHDLLVIGSGPAGYRAAVLARLRGWDVAIAEQAAWGGTCLNRGCVPKKAWHHTARLVAHSRSGDWQARGLQTPLQADFAAAWQHQKDVVGRVRDSYVDYLRRLGVTRYEGRARFIDAQRVQVNEQTLAARHYVIATGSAPRVPAPFQRIPGRVLTTDDLFDAPPPTGRKAALVGGGVIGVEFAFILAMLGHDIVWLTRASPLSHGRYSAPALKLLGEALARHGIAPRQTTVQGLAQTGNGLALGLADGATLDVDWLLLGTGRLPNTAELGLPAAGVALDAQGYVAVNAHLQTSQAHIYAIGDCANPVMNANQALADAAVAVANLIEPGSRARQPEAVPELVYSALELGRLGLNEEQAEDAGLEPATGFAAFETNPRALGMGAAEGYVRLVAELDSGALLGAEVVGADAGELIHLVAARYGRTDALASLAQSFYNHPALGEEMQNAAETLGAKWGLMEQVFGKAPGA